MWLRFSLLTILHQVGNPIGMEGLGLEGLSTPPRLMTPEPHMAPRLTTPEPDEDQEDEAGEEERDDEDADGRPRRLRPGRLGAHLVRHAQPDQP